MDPTRCGRCDYNPCQCGTGCRTYWQFGDVVRVDWDALARSGVTKPDEDTRRWMVLTTANTSADRRWAFLFLGGNTPEPLISHWSSAYGFERVDE